MIQSSLLTFQTASEKTTREAFDITAASSANEFASHTIADGPISILSKHF